MIPSECNGGHLSGASGSEPQAQKASGERTCRKRINSSMGQLKSLLRPEFFKQQPDSKLEKADILEMQRRYISCSKTK